MWFVRLVGRLAVAALLTWPLVWLGCGLPALFGIYFTLCGHNAYIWFVPAFLLAFAALSLVPALRLSSAGAAANLAFKRRRPPGAA